jgi:predicted AlkP superfamily pyrophosphatase or phosphodiesterase
MTRRFFFPVLCAFFFLAPPASPASPQREGVRPKLVVGIVVDQFRYDYLTRFRSDYIAGFDRLMKQGGLFTNARFIHFPSITAVGHSTFLTGATPQFSGIIGNEWYDRETGKTVTSVSDDAVALLGAGGGSGASPRRLLVSTIGDELKAATGGRSRVIGVSIKDRGAILPAGHRADGAYWFDARSGNFVSSSFYFSELPAWVSEFNKKRPADRYLGAEWTPVAVGSNGGAPAKPFKKMAETAGPAFYTSLEASPYGNELVAEFAERIIEAEQLGRRGTTDLVTISFSSNDYIGHSVGPDAPEVRDISIRTDRVLGKLFEFLDAKIGLANVLVVFTADHGVSPAPEALQRNRMPGGRVPSKAIEDPIRNSLSARFGEGNWIDRVIGGTIYLNRGLIRKKSLDEAEVQRVAAEAASGAPHVFRVFTREQLLGGRVTDDRVSRFIVNGYYPPRSADLIVLLEPYWMTASSGTTHGSIFGYDTHVPVVFMGAGIRPGWYHASASPNDIAPTLATLLSIETPSGSIGRVLAEMLAE